MHTLYVYQNIIHLHCIKTLKILSSTSNVKGKFFKINTPHGVQSASMNIPTFHFLEYSRILKKMSITDEKIITFL
jgi:hypothetical protein